MLYLWASAVAKVSIALALLRLTVRQAHRIILWTIIGVVTAIGLMFWLVLLFDCHPISYFWLRLEPTHSGTCLSIDTLLAIAYLYSAITIFCDLTLGILPVFLIWRLQMNGRTKVALGVILSLGAMYVSVRLDTSSRNILTRLQRECGGYHPTPLSTLLWRHRFPL